MHGRRAGKALRGDGGGANQLTNTTQGTPLKNARERMDVIAAYRDVGSYRGAAAICGTTHKTVKRIVEQHEASGAGSVPVERIQRARNFDDVTDLVAEKGGKTSGRISAKRLLPLARAAGYVGSPRNFRRLVSDAKAGWRHGNPGGRRPGVWTPGETLIIDWVSRVGCTCSAPCWPGRGSGSSGSTPTRRPPRHSACWPSASRSSVVSPRSCSRTGWAA
jgi:hypothetical protein